MLQAFDILDSGNLSSKQYAECLKLVFICDEPKIEKVYEKMNSNFPKSISKEGTNVFLHNIIVMILIWNIPNGVSNL